MTRRTMLRTGGAAALAASWWATPSASASALTALTRQSPLKRSTYATLANRTFHLRLPEPTRWATLELQTLSDLPRADTLKKYAGAQNAFSLVFRGPAGIGQGTYRIEHPAFGATSLFVTPVGPTLASTIPGSGPAQDYEILVDRLYRPTVRSPAPVRQRSADA